MPTKITPSQVAGLAPVATSGSWGDIEGTPPEGAAGASGEPGSQGAQGDPGPAGTEPGPQGDPGAQGATGPQGTPGETGPQGATGPQGLQGDQGLQGFQGLQGDQGYVGTQGAAGPQGDAGDPSDIRLKRDLQSVQGLDFIRQLKVYDFQWNDLVPADLVGKREVGLIAQDIEALYDPAVVHSNSSEFLRLTYSKFVPFLIRAVQELAVEVDTLKAQLGGRN